MFYSKATQMNILQKIKAGELVPHDEKHDFVLLDLADEGLISFNESSDISVTYFGFKSLQEWDPVLEASFNHQLIEKPYGYA